MKINKTLLIFSLIAVLISVKAQIPNNSWRDHLSYIHARTIAEIDNKIYCATTGGIFSVNKKDNSVQKYSKVNGLSDITINVMNYSDMTSTLVIGYDNGNIDLIRNDSIINIPDLKLKLIMGDKNIYNIQFIDSYAYLSCGFGIVVIDLYKKEIKDTYQFGNQGNKIKVNCIAFNGQNIFAATSDGIFKADINSPNLVDYNNWTRLTNVPFEDVNYSSIVYFGNKLLSIYRNPSTNADDIIEIKDNSWNIWDRSYQNYYKNFFIHNNFLHVISLWATHVFDSDYNELSISVSDYPNFGLCDKDGIVWVADPDKGLLKFTGGYLTDEIAPNGPDYLDVGEIVYSQGNMWVAGGNEASQWSGTGAYLFKDEQWYNFNKKDIPEMDSFLNIHRIAVVPNEPDRIYGGSFGYGVIELNINKQVNIYNKEDGVLNVIEGENGDIIRVKGLSYDVEGNLWIVCSDDSNPVYVIRPNGDWENIELEYSDFGKGVNISDIYANSYGDVWIALLNKGILSFREENGTYLEKFFLIKNQEEETSNKVYTITEDLDGDMWVGTDIGPIVYYKPSNIYEETVSGYQVLIPRNDGTNNADLLLYNEQINCICIDGANRKWFGTEKSGAFLISSDGKDQIYSFNSGNSPLFSDNVISIAINNDNGEVFFGTGKGILSYKGQATTGGDDFKDVYVYPNPVRENYNGDITIKGLVRDANVKITDISGNLVNETTALGGQAIWNGRNFKGERVHTGVYLVFCSNEDGTKTYVTKLLFIH